MRNFVSNVKILMLLLLFGLMLAIFPVSIKAAEGNILINTTTEPSVPGQAVMAGGNVNLYFGHVNFSSSGFLLELSPNNQKNLTIDDYPYAYFDVSNLTRSSISTYTDGIYQWLVGFNWINGSIPRNIEAGSGGSGNYYVKAFDGASTLAVTDTYLTITANFEVVPTSGGGGAPITLMGNGLPPFDYVNLSCYNLVSGHINIASFVSINSSGQFTYNTRAPDMMLASGSGLTPESAYPVIFACNVNSTNRWYTMDFTEYKRGLIQLGTEIADEGYLFGNGTMLSSAVSVGSGLRVVGKWFYPGDMTVLWDGVTNIGTATVNDAGVFDTNITIPVTSTGAHNIVLKDANNVNFFIMVNVVGGYVYFSPIQALINAANPGDTVYVPTGHYYGHVAVNKTVKLVGGNSASTIIDGNFTGSVVNVTANDVEISGFTIQNSDARGIGIHVKTCLGCNISGNVIRNNFQGLVLYGCSNILISGNSIQLNFGTPGILIEYSSSVTFSKNNVANNVGEAVVVFSCSNSTVSENQIVSNGYGDVFLGTGAVVSNSRDITVSKNNITSNAGTGLNLVGSHDNSIFGNNMRSNRAGIILSTSTSNNIYQNTVQVNYYGIEFYFSSNNYIYHNNFINNSIQTNNFHGSETNSYDNGYPSGGNYWSDHVCAGNPSDGSQPYIIDENNTDHYPFQDPNGWINTLTIYSSPTGVTFTVDGVSRTTPWSGTYTKGTLVSLVMPEIHTFGDARYYWSQWGDENTSRLRTVSMTTNITLTAYYTGPYYELTVTSSPMTGIAFTINGTPQTTLYTEWLLEGSYTLEMPEAHNGYVWSHWLEEGDPNRTKIVTMDTNITLTAVFIDTTPPNISIVSPENKTYTTSSVPLSFTVDESTSWIGYSLDGQANITIAGNTTLTGLSDGMHSLIVYASDIAGNMGSSDMVHFTIDTTPPTICIISPENKTYTTTDVPLNFTVTESVSWVAYSLDGQANVTIAGNTTLTGLSDGSHSLTVYAKDTAGNTGSSETIYFSIEPFPVTWVVAAIAIIAVAGVALLVYFAKVKKTTEKAE